ncbi:GGDEF domain-containing protein [Erythrobacter litoralis]|uniref:GGDEF domain-containing protein n=1 Tax=Erythrobacter litoralis (strain HTCC2594) TaxID=314225 RepID=Q2N7K9_ERYLH|nr:sensor domain-containing diguanylate cyclase [Erythrobacter litoralis]ABC64332.1 hypothetical protein ELI_11200 [Erythrobacter litoralis HTCC2594]
MGLRFSAGDLAQFLDLSSGLRSDILLKLDAEGFILSSSRALETFGSQGSDGHSRLLIAPRLSDLVVEGHTRAVGSELALAAAGNADRGWIEVRLTCGGESWRWFSLRLVPARNKAGAASVLAVLRDIHERRTLEDKLFAARMTDPLTGLTNRVAFDSMLDHVSGSGPGGCLALFGVDHLRAINHRLGHNVGDQVLCGFAEVLRTVMRTGDTISRIGDATFAVLLLDTDDREASALTRQAQDVFAGDLPAGKSRLTLSATVGIAEIGTGPEDTLRRAEMAMFLGKAGSSTRPVLERDSRPRRAVASRAASTGFPQLRRAG